MNGPADTRSFYARTHALVPDRRFVFMNHGFHERGQVIPDLPPEEEVFRPCFALVEKTVQGVPLQGRAVLDVGCGRGGSCYYLSRYKGAGRVTGVDLSTGAVAFCRARYPGIDFVQGDAHALPIAPDSVHCVVNIESSHCYDDKPAFFDEVHRVLRRGGHFAYADCFHRDDDPEGLLQSSPLTLLSVEDITAGVSRAMDLYRDSHARHLLSMVDDALGNRPFIDSMIRRIGRAYRCYQRGDAVYLRFILQRR